MAANTPQSAAFAITRRVFQQCRQLKSSRATPSLRSASRTFATTQFRSETNQNRTSFDKFIDPATEQDQFAKAKEPKEETGSRPRWSYTPEGMKAPFSPHTVKDPSRKVWANNKDPVKLDQMYQRLLGNGGDRLLPEEIRWLAVTHKSFDQGRRGFNDRLAFLGMSLQQDCRRLELANEVNQVGKRLFWRLRRIFFPARQALAPRLKTSTGARRSKMRLSRSWTT